MKHYEIGQASLPGEDNWDRREVKLYSYDEDEELVGYVRYVQERPQMWLSIFVSLLLSYMITLLIGLFLFVLYVWYDLHRLMLHAKKFKNWIEKCTKNLGGFIRSTVRRGQRQHFAKLHR